MDSDPFFLCHAHVFMERTMPTCRILCSAITAAFLAIPAGAQPPALKDVHGDPLPPGAIARLGAMRFRIGGPAAAVRFLNDGKTIFVKANTDDLYWLTENTRFYLFDAETGRELSCLKAAASESAAKAAKHRPGRGVLGTECALSPDGKWLANFDPLYGKRGGTLLVREVITGKLAFSVDFENHSLAFPQFAPDGKSIAAIVGRPPTPSDDGPSDFMNGFSGNDGPWEICIWDMRTGKEIRSLKAADAIPRPDSLAFSPNGATIAAVCPSRGKFSALVGWDVSGARPAWTLNSLPSTWRGKSEFTPFAFSRDSKMLAVARDGALGLWDSATGKYIKDIAKPSQTPRMMAFSGDGKKLITIQPNLAGSNDGKLYLWDLDNQKPIDLQIANPSGFLISPSGDTLAVVKSLGNSDEFEISIHDGSTGAIRHQIRGLNRSWRFGQAAEEQGLGSQLAFSPDGSALVLGDRPGQLRRIDVKTGKDVAPPSVSTDSFDAILFSPDGTNILAAGRSSIAIQDARGSKPAMMLPIVIEKPDLKFGREQEARASFHQMALPISTILAFSNDGTLAAAGWAGGSVAVWETSTAKLLWQKRIHEATIFSLTFSPDQQSLLSSDMSGRMIWWSKATGEVRRTLELQARPILFERNEAFSLRISPGGRTAFGVNGYRHDLQEWELSTGKMRRSFRFDSNVVDLSADGKAMMMFAGYGYHLADVATGTVKRSFPMETSHFHGSSPLGWCRLSPNSQLVAGIIDVGAVRIWDANTAATFGTLRSQSSGICALAFAPDGKTVATCGSDGTILVWQVPSQFDKSVKTQPPAPQTIATWWASLIGDDVVAARKALDQLASAHGSMPWLKEKLAEKLSAPESAKLRIIELLVLIGGADAVPLLKQFADDKTSVLAARSAHAALASRPIASEKSSRSSNSRFDRVLGSHPAVAARVGDASFQCGGEVIGLRFLPDRKTILANTRTDESRRSSTHGLCLLDTETRKAVGVASVTEEELFRLNGHKLPHEGWSVSHDGKLLATVNAQLDARKGMVPASLCVREVGTDRVLLNAMEQVYLLGEVRFAAGGTSLVVAPRGRGPIRLFDLNTGTDRPLENGPGDELDADDIRISPDGKILLAASAFGKNAFQIRWWNLDRGGPPKRLPFDEALIGPPNPKVLSDTGDGVFSADSSRIAILASGKADKKRRLIVLHLESGKVVCDCGEQKQVYGCSFSMDGKQLAALCADKLRRWDLTSGKELAAIDAPSNADFQLTPDAKAVGIADKFTLRVHEANTGKELYRFQVADAGTTHETSRILGKNKVSRDANIAFAFSPDASRIVVADRRTLRQFDIRNGKEIGPEPYSHTIHSVASSDSASIVADLSSWRVRIWDSRSAKQIMQIKNWPDAEENAVAFTAIALSADGRRAAVGASDGSIGVFDVPSGTLVKRVKFQDAVITSVLFLADGNTLISSDILSNVAYWDAGSGTLLRKRTAGEGPYEKDDWEKQARSWHELYDAENYYSRLASAPTFTRNGFHLLVPGNDEIDLIELASFKAHSPSFARSDRGKTVISRDGRLLVFCARSDFDPVLRIVDTASRTEICSVFCLPGIRDLAISPDDKWLAACGTDGLRIWDLATGTDVGSVNGHVGIVTALQFSADGTALVSAGFDSTLLVWDIAALTNPPPPKDLTATELETLWTQLASADAAAADRALRALLAHPTQATDLLRPKLLPLPAPSAEKLAQLVTDLDSPLPKTREKASTDLAKLEEIAEPALRQCLTANPTLEHRLRAEMLLKRLGQPIANTQKLQALRAVELLEYIATPASRSILETLQSGPAGSYITRDAKAALQRIKG
jgi:WD40 repeat protein